MIFHQAPAPRIAGVPKERMQPADMIVLDAEGRCQGVASSAAACPQAAKADGASAVPVGERCG